MAKAYSMDLRQRVVAACDEGKLPVSQVARHFRVKRWWIYDLLRLRRETGSILPRQGRRGPKHKLAPHHRERIGKQVQANPDATLEEIREQLGLDVSLTTLWWALDDMKVSFKKKS